MVRINAPLQLLVTNLDYDEHKGRICIGRITSGKITRGETVAIAKPGAPAGLQMPRRPTPYVSGAPPRNPKWFRRQGATHWHTLTGW